MVLRPYWIVLGLIVYYPFEDFMLKWLPVSDTVLTVLRLGSEGVLYGLLLIVVVNRLLKGNAIQKTPVDSFLLAFIVFAGVSIVLNRAPLLGSIINMRVLVRYITIYYVIVNLHLTRKHIQQLLFFILFIAFGESLLAIFQHFIGVSEFWYPRQSEVEVAGYQKTYAILTRGIEEGASIGTFGHSVAMGLYLLIAEVLILGQVLVSWEGGYTKKQMLLLAIGALIFVAIFFSYSRGLMLSACVALPMILFCLKRRRSLFVCLCFGGFAVYVLVGIGLIAGGGQSGFVDVKRAYVNPVENLTMLFTSEYFEQTSSGRQWILTEVSKAILKSGNLIGFSPDEETARAKIVASSGGTLNKLLSYQAFEDVFWVAMLAYYGFIGLGLFILILLRIYRAAIWVVRNSLYRIDRVVSVTASVLILIVLPMTFIIKTFEFRHFSFYFWLISGLVMAEYIRLKSGVSRAM
jgi:hypothetical protein